MTPEKELTQKIIKILAQYYELKGIPAGEWNRIEAIIQQAKTEWCKQQRENTWEKFRDYLKRKEFIMGGDTLIELEEIILNAPEP